MNPNIPLRLGQDGPVIGTIRSVRLKDNGDVTFEADITDEAAADRVWNSVRRPGDYTLVIADPASPPAVAPRSVKDSPQA